MVYFAVFALILVGIFTKGEIVVDWKWFITLLALLYIGDQIRYYKEKKFPDNDKDKKIP